ncbi:MAG: dihydroorotase [Capsulimonadales bacterium]|nr:dihydroorotase [Capsulimonadales bacterium]
MILKNGHIIDPAGGTDGIGDLRIVDGRIAELAVGFSLEPAPDEETVDCAGKVVAPGLIDIHVHLRVPGQEYKEDLESGLAAAAAGGFTAVACMPNTKPVIDNASIVRDLYAQAERIAGARLHVIAALSKGMLNAELSEMADLQDAGAVAVSDDAFQVQDAGFLRRAMEYARMLGLPVLAHCEDISLTEGGAMNEGYVSTVLGIRGMPREAYESHVARNCLLSLKTGAHLHVLHVSTAREVEILRFFKAQGANVTAETGPHYWCLTDDACRGYDPHAKMNPPLRTEADCAAIIEGLKDGTLDAIATDHAPHAAYEKAQEFALAPFGIVGLETSLALGITYLVKPGHLSMAQLIERMSAASARILGLPGGTLSPGDPADITVIDTDATRTVDPDSFVSKGRNTPFGGRTLTGTAFLTLVGGTIVHRGG